MKITTEHAASSYGIPVILDDAGEPLDYAPGVVAVRARLGLTQAQLAERLGSSVRTVQNWEQGHREIPAGALLQLSAMLGRPF